ncbi:dTDP-glucose 4,6-dehydratase [Streptomyces cremeus]|uniref:dTDP-glucose 4,6-dehydratase n=1 Tax=Streptomyces cremeus TaxID=66881 RepID=A0ABV5PHK3_STRCM
MNILLTGGAGFIGSAYARLLLGGRIPGREQDRVTVLDLLTYAGRRDNLPAEHPRLTFVHGDVCDRSLLLDLLPGHDAVVHFAAESHVDRSIDSAAAFVRTNVLGTQTLLDACLRTGVGPVVVVSTDEVYGSIDHGKWTEESPLAPNSPYAASKASGDLVARAYGRTHGLDVRITRCCNNYGPRQHPEKLIPHFTSRLLAGESVPLYGTGRNVREWLHVDDHARAVDLVLAKGAPGGVYNIGSGDALTNARLAALLVELTGADPGLVRRVADRKGHDLRYALDDSRIRRELGYAPQIPFAEGLAATVEWHRAHPAWR